MSTPNHPNELVPAAARLRIVFTATAASEDEMRWAVGAAQALRARGHAVAVAAPSGAPFAAQAAASDVPTHTLRAGARFDPRVARSLRAAFETPDVVFALDPQALVLARRASRALVLARTEDPGLWRGTGDLQPAAMLVPPGDWTQVGAGNGTPPVRVVADLVDSSAPAARPDPTATRRALRLPRRVHLALYVAPLVAGNGHATLLHALAHLHATTAGPSARLVVAFLGTGPEEAELRVLSQDLDVKDRVLWVGARKDVTAYVAAADSLLVLRAAATPRRARLDAAAFGVPIVALDTDVRVATDDAEGWADALARVTASGAAPSAAATSSASSDAGSSAVHVAADLECAAYAHDLRRHPLPQRAALFLDRDGTLVRNVPYNADPGAVVLEPHAGRALRWARDAGFELVVTSNQSGIGRGLVTPADVQAIHERIRAELRRDGADLDALYFCPHLPEDGCTCRKPRPGLLQQAAAERRLDVARSTGIGDAPRDIEAAHAAGARARGYQPATAEPQDWPAGTLVHDDWLLLVRDVLAEVWAEGRGVGGG